MAADFFGEAEQNYVIVDTMGVFLLVSWGHSEEPVVVYRPVPDITRDGTPIQPRFVELGGAVAIGGPRGFINVFNRRTGSLIGMMHQGGRLKVSVLAVSSSSS